MPPILAHQKLIGLANCVAVSAPQSVISFMQWSFKNWEKWKSMRQGFAAAFAKNERLHQQISTKYKSSKLFWRILEDKKRNRCENCSRKTVRIFVCNTPSQLCLPDKFFTHNEFLAGWLFCLQGLAYFDEYYQQIHVCLFLIWYFNEKLKIKRLLEVNSKSCRVSEQCSIFWKFFTLLLACSMWIRGKATCCVCTTSSGTNSSNAKMITCLLSIEMNLAVTWLSQFCTSHMLFHNQYIMEEENITENLPIFKQGRACDIYHMT